ncbi:general transcription factor 3C polypeptide 5 [Copidosoma floridanum]|uniref:general transcription factor 3C polypeptide 5 n=1 Tax=Copidosoma floridanum TaxID=29053 RepID=UPI0006C98855|nr:general transcription factor 3C polypeptide 5 [Copidosoma floridanum]
MLNIAKSMAHFDDDPDTSNDPESDESYNEQSDDDGDYESDNESQDRDGNECVGPVLPGGHRFDKKLICIKYPGNVINPDKAIETLGGLSDISSTVDNKSRRMELKFRPSDGYCNPTCGDRNETVGFLLRVRVKKSRREKLEGSVMTHDEVEEKVGDECTDDDSSQKITSHSSRSKVNEKISNQDDDCESNKDDSGKDKPPSFDREKYENLSKDVDYRLPKLKVLGKVDTEFRFTSLCDFQYLPITKNIKDPSKDECIYDKIYPIGMPPVSWMDNEVPYFLPPAAFSRMDSVQQYLPKPEAPTSNPLAPDVIGRTRKRRGGLSNYISFNSPDVPMNPPEGIETALKVKFLQQPQVEEMQKLFDQRPIWSRNALRYLTKFTNEQLKVLLPSVAYYFTTGPWRVTWVKLGYDPRKDPKSRKYQTLDFRMKGTDGLLSNIRCKRGYSDVSMKNRNVPNTKSKTTVLTPNSSFQPQKKSIMMDENVYIYRPGMIPPSRQMFYQYCDVHVKEIQDMLDKYLGPPPGTPCHEKMGWLPSNFDDLCREILSKYVRIELRKMMNIPENHPTTLPRKLKILSDRTIQKKKKKLQQTMNSIVSAPINEKNYQEEVEYEDVEVDEIEQILSENGNKAQKGDHGNSDDEFHGFAN